MAVIALWKTTESLEASTVMQSAADLRRASGDRASSGNKGEDGFRLDLRDGDVPHSAVKRSEYGSFGHESIETTHIYVEADLAIKERALERIAPANCSVRRFKADDTLLAFLASL